VGGLDGRDGAGQGRWRTWDSAPKASVASPSTRTEEVGSLWCAAGRKKGRRWLPWLVDRVHGPRAPAAGRDKRGLVGLIQEGMDAGGRAEGTAEVDWRWAGGVRGARKAVKARGTRLSVSGERRQRMTYARHTNGHTFLYSLQLLPFL
jgi:hypothetical protein